MSKGMLREIEVIVEPGAPLGASFEYKNGALTVKDFADGSLLPRGIEIGMNLSHIQNEMVIGYSQSEVLDLLKRRTNELKVIRFRAFKEQPRRHL